MAVFATGIFVIGLLFTRTGSRSGQAFFEAGGRTPWWINGLSLFISYFSAGTFVVWGSIAYKSGLVSNAIQLTMAVSGLLVAIFISGKWKTAGVKTAAEYIGKRFGSGPQQYYTYVILLYSLFSVAAVLYPVGKMVYVVTPFSLNTCIIAIGITIILYTAAGGLWAVLVTDVIQFVVLSAAVLIVIPIAFHQIGGVPRLFDKAPPGFFKPLNGEYTLGFMLAFIVYQTVYLGGNWSYVQRYTSVGTVKDAKKVAYLFAALYLVSPVIWMIPPMVYRIVNPHLQGLESEGAYMLFCLKVMPAGLIGLVLAGMVSATSSKANTTINLTATVFARDLYKGLIRPRAPEREMILIARLFTLVFGAATIMIAILIPRAGGIVEVVLSIASIAGGALYAPIVWSLYSRRQTGFSIVAVSVVSLSVNLFFKVCAPSLLGLALSRTAETIYGVGLPILLLGLFEAYYAIAGKESDIPSAGAHSKYGSGISGIDREAGPDVSDDSKEARRQNAFGVKVIALSMCAVGTGILLLGILATQFSGVVIAVGCLVLVPAIWMLIKTRSQ
jgi:SSS family solute:Na+ symporter